MFLASKLDNPPVFLTFLFAIVVPNSGEWFSSQQILRRWKNKGAPPVGRYGVDSHHTFQRPHQCGEAVVTDVWSPEPLQ